MKIQSLYISDDEKSDIDYYTLLEKAGIKGIKKLNEIPLEDIHKGQSSDFIRFIYPYRLQLLLGDKQQKEVAEETNLSAATLSAQFNGNSEARMCSLARLSGYFGVSADYLLGMTDIKSIVPEKTSACKYTSLSDDAVEVLHKSNEESEHHLRKQIISYLIETGKLTEIATLLERAIISSLQFSILYEDKDTDFQNEQLESLEYQFTKKLSGLYTSTVEDISEKYGEEINDIINERWETLQDAAIETSEKMEEILQQFSERDAYRIHQMAEADKEQKK